MEFHFHVPEVMEVYLTGEFNQWDTCSLPMKKDKDGIWKTKIKLPPGRYEYKLFADDEWFEDIACDVRIEGTSVLGTPGAEQVSNPFGT